MSTIDVVAGLGEIGNPILKLFSTTTNVLGYDINPKLIDQKNLKNISTMMLNFYTYVFHTVKVF